LKGCGDKAFGSFLPPSKNTASKAAIVTFVQGTDESLCEAWEIFKVLLKKFHNHGFEVEMQVHIFCNGFQPQMKTFWMLLLLAQFCSNL